jgi:tetratricopeptide (TPR) repeat protein
MGLGSDRSGTLTHALSLMEQGTAFRRSGDPRSAVASHQQAREVIGEPQGTTEVGVVALILANLGNALQDAGDVESALAALDESIRLWDSLVESGEPKAWEELAATYQQRANLLVAAGAYDDAVAAAGAAVPLYRDLLARGRSDLRSAFGRLLGSYSIGLERTFELHEARAVLDEYLAVFEGSHD